jgi:hypothetical protein
MSDEAQINCMKACVDWFDSIGYAGVGRQGLVRCIAAFQAGDSGEAIAQYRQMIAEAPNFASVLTDLDSDSFTPELYEQYFNHIMTVMFSMSFLMGGKAK